MHPKVDVVWGEDSVGETPTGATSSFAKASEDRGTVALPRKLLMIGDPSSRKTSYCGAFGFTLLHS